MIRFHSFFAPSSRWYFPLRWLVLIFLGLAIYGQTFGYGFVFDDFQFIVNNPCITRFDYVHYIWKVYPQTRTIGFYSFALNYFINQLHPAGYHLFNFVIHLLTTGLVWAVAALLFKIVKWDDKELPFIIAVLFLVHPGQTQAVTYISQRFESMATLFYLASIYFYLRGRIAVLKTNKILLFSSCAAFALLGIFTKEVAVTIPLMIFALELILFNKKPVKSKKNQPRPPYLLIIVLGAIFILLFMKMVQTNFVNIYFHFTAPSESHDGDIITGGKYVLTQMRVFLTFLRLLVLPIHQNVDYDYPLSTGLLTPPLTLLGICVIGFMAFLIFKLRQQRPLISLGLAWILITFSINTAPRINLIFEHKLYLISFGFFLAAVCALSAMIRDRKLLFGILIMFIIILSLVSFKRNQVWKNETTLWADVLSKSPHKARPHYNRGYWYFHQGKLPEALLDFNEAIKTSPNYISVYINRGILFDEEGQFTQALADYNKAIEINPNLAEAYYNRANTYVKENNLSQALADYNKAIEINPDYVDAYGNRGSVFVKEGNLTEALVNYNKAIEIYPQLISSTGMGVGFEEFKAASVGNVFEHNYTRFADAYYNRGNIYSHHGYLAQAISDFTEVIKIDPHFYDAYNNRGICYSEQGNLAQALLDYNKAIEIKPTDAEGYINRGICYAQQGRLLDALSDYNKAIAITPNYTQIYYNRAVTYFQLKRYDQAWQDVNKVISLGGRINPKFMEDLKNSSRL